MGDICLIQVNIYINKLIEEKKSEKLGRGGWVIAPSPTPLNTPLSVQLKSTVKISIQDIA